MESKKRKRLMDIARVCSFWIVALVVVYFKFFYTTKERLEDRNMKLFYDGEVVEKYVDKKNHNNRIIILNTGKRLVFPPKSYHLYDSISIGDRMLKEKATLEGTVFKDSTQFFFDYQ